jgi:hypothetical protein
VLNRDVMHDLCYTTYLLAERLGSASFQPAIDYAIQIYNTV